MEATPLFDVGATPLFDVWDEQWRKAPARATYVIAKGSQKDLVVDDKVEQWRITVVSRVWGFV